MGYRLRTVSSPAAPAIDDARPVLDVPDLYDSAGESRELVEVILNAFRKGAPAQLEDLRAAVERADRASIASATHRLRSALAQVCGPAATAACSALEGAAPAADPAELARLFATLDSAFGALSLAITAELAKARG